MKIDLTADEMVLLRLTMAAAEQELQETLKSAQMTKSLQTVGIANSVLSEAIGNVMRIRKKLKTALLEWSPDKEVSP